MASFRLTFCTTVAAAETKWKNDACALEWAVRTEGAGRSSAWTVGDVARQRLWLRRWVLLSLRFNRLRWWQSHWLLWLLWSISPCKVLRTVIWFYDRAVHLLLMRSIWLWERHAGLVCTLWPQKWRPPSTVRLWFTFTDPWEREISLWEEFHGKWRENSVYAESGALSKLWAN
jgi:hypothetical protein